MCPVSAESLLGEPAEGAFPTISSGVPPKTARVDVDPASAKELEQHITTLFGRLEALPLVDGRLHGCATLPLVESLSQGRPPSYTSRATSAVILLLLALPGSRGSKLPVEKPNPGERMSARHQHTPGALDSTWKIITVPSGLMQHMLDAGELVSKGGPMMAPDLSTVHRSGDEQLSHLSVDLKLFKEQLEGKKGVEQPIAYVEADVLDDVGEHVGRRLERRRLWTLETLDCYSAYYNDEWNFTPTRTGQDCQPSSGWFGTKTDAECISHCKSNGYAFAIVPPDSNCNATVVRLALTFAGALSDYSATQITTLKDALSVRLNCTAPTCVMILHLSQSAASSSTQQAS
eukprot:jgi/Chrpa1/9640/Chrysochromulina_OHIO_Genome00014975-RA